MFRNMFLQRHSIRIREQYDSVCKTDLIKSGYARYRKFLCNEEVWSALVFDKERTFVCRVGPEEG